MAAPAASYVQLPTDTSNTGKKNRTQTKAVGSDTVHEHFVVPSPAYTRVGRYAYQSSVNVLTTAAAATTHLVLAMTTAATYRAVIRSIELDYGVGGTVAASTTPINLLVLKATYGTAFSASTNGQVIAYQSSSTASQLNAYLGSSGASIGTPTTFAAFAFPAFVTTVGSYGGRVSLFRDNTPQLQVETGLEMKAGDLLQFIQDTTGNNGEVRRFSVRVEFDQIDVS